MSIKAQVWFGTESGNSERLAVIAHKAGTRLGIESELVDMAQADLNSLQETDNLLMVISTNGDGEMPLNAEFIWDEAKEEQKKFKNLTYGVLGLGDSSYDYFCQAGIDWDLYLMRGGAKQFNQRADLDLDFHTPAIEWITKSLKAISGKSADEVKAAIDNVLAGAAEEETDSDLYNQNNPWQASIIDKRTLTGSGSSKSVRHYALNLEGSDIHYKPGDCIEVVPVNDEALADELIDFMMWDQSEQVIVDGKNYPLRYALINKLEIRQPTLRFVKLMAAKSRNQAFKDIMSDGTKQQIDDYSYGKDVITLVKSNCKPPLQREGLKASIQRMMGNNPVYPVMEPQIFVGYMKSLQPRAYSIASSQKANPNEVHLTIADVKYQHEGRNHKGACSIYLADKINQGDKVNCWLLRNRYFAVPEDGNRPVIMVGPGTGIAPFVGFLQERQVSGDSGKNWLFFGDREAEQDFLYKEEITAFQSSGLLTKLDLAFSRDQEEKVYVQHRMKEHAKELFEWLEEGAAFYICGDARNMAADVEETLYEIIQQGKSCDRKESEAYVKQMAREKRYLKDVY